MPPPAVPTMSCWPKADARHWGCCSMAAGSSERYIAAMAGARTPMTQVNKGCLQSIRDVVDLEWIQKLPKHKESERPWMTH